MKPISTPYNAVYWARAYAVGPLCCLAFDGPRVKRIEVSGWSWRYVAPCDRAGVGLALIFSEVA